MPKVFCVTGIDTDIGKTVVTGLMAKSFRAHGINVITQKIVQTGCAGVSEDIVCHRQAMGIELLPEDLDGTTCPYCFSVPCSPHLAAQLENSEIDCADLRTATAKLLLRFDVVLLEGVGGLLVPLNKETTLLDYLEAEKYPLILVSSPRLGSINHTLAALELIRTRNLELAAIIYNLAGSEDPRIVNDSRRVFNRYLQKYNFHCDIIDLPEIDDFDQENTLPDFYNLLH